MIDTGHLQLDACAAVRAVVRCFRVPLRPKEVPTTRYRRGGKGPGMAVFLSLPVVLHAFSHSMELATTVLGEQKPQQNQDYEFMDELYIQEKHRLLHSF